MTKTFKLNQYIIHYERKVKQKCQICSSTFKFGNAEHICKKCYRSVCQNCSHQSKKCYMANYKIELHRHCRKCEIQSQSLQKYVKNNHLRWGDDSDLVKFWSRQMGLKSLPRKRNSERKAPNQYVGFMQIWNSLNYSFREFIGMVLDQSEINQIQIVQLVNLALCQLSTNKLVDLQHLIYIIMFFLAHSSVQNAIYFTTLIVQTIYTQEFSMQTMHHFLQQIGCIAIQTYKMQNIIEETFQKISKRCSVNVFSTEISIEIITKILIKRDFEELEKGIAIVFAQRKQFICQNSNKPQGIIIDILRNTSVSSFRKTLAEIDGSNFETQSCGRSQRSINSDSSDKNSNSTILNRQVNKLKKQNDQLNEKVKGQSAQLQNLKRQNQALQKEIQIKRDNEKKNLQVSFSKTVSQMNLRKQNSHKDKYGFSTSEQDDELNYNHVLQKKNQQIILLKRQLQNAQQKLQQAIAINKAEQAPKQASIPNQNDKKTKKQKQEQVQKLKQQVQTLKNSNKVLFNKLNQLSNLLVDKQQKNMKQANKFFDQIDVNVQSTIKAKGNQCRMQ